MAQGWGYRLHEWRDLSEDDRDLLMAHSALVCPDCGNLRSVCSDPSIDWHPQTATCWPTATRQWASEQLAKKHKEWKGEGLHPAAGRSLWVTQHEPEVDEFGIEVGLVASPDVDLGD